MIAYLYILISVFMNTADNTSIGCQNLFVDYLLQFPKLEKVLNDNIAYCIFHEDIEQAFNCLDMIYTKFAARRKEKERFDINSIIQFHEDTEQIVYICIEEKYQHLNSLVKKNKPWYIALRMDLIDEWNRLSILQKKLFNETIARFRTLTSDGLALHGIYGVDETIKTRLEAFAVVHSAFEICHQLVIDYKFVLPLDNQTAVDL